MGDEMNKSQQVAKVFDDWALRGRAEGMERGHERAARVGFAALNIGEHDRYLDIGCGNGYSVRWAAAIAPTVNATGIDVSAEMIERARSQSGDFDNATFLCETFPSGATTQRNLFDAIFSMEVFYYLADPPAAVNDVVNCLAPGGRFVCILDHYRENEASHSWGDDLGLSLHLASEREWRKYLEAAGLTSVRSERVRAPSGDNQELSWEQREGSLFLFGTTATS